jgi:glucokinase
MAEAIVGNVHGPTSEALVTADIGGTNGRIRVYLLESSGSNGGDPVVQNQPWFDHVYRMSMFSNYTDLVHECVKDVLAKGNVRFVSGCFAVCGPVWNGGETNDPNNLWPGKLESAANLAALFNIENKGAFRFINDFEAIGHSLAALHDTSTAFPDICKPKDLHTLHEPAERVSNTVIACMGAGTGLGLVYLTPSENGAYNVFPSEGGMVDSFSPRTEEEWKLKRFLMEKHGEYIEIERIVSGPGLVDVYRFFCDEGLPSFNDEGRKRMALLNSIAPDEQGSFVSKLARAAATQDSNSSDPALKALDLFLKVYGKCLGTTTINFLPYSGLYIAGGILQKVLWRLEQHPGFVNAYLSQGPKMSEIPAKIPLTLIGDSSVGLSGALKMGYSLRKGV